MEKQIENINPLINSLNKGKIHYEILWRENVKKSEYTTWLHENFIFKSIKIDWTNITGHKQYKYKDINELPKKFQQIISDNKSTASIYIIIIRIM